MKNTLKRAAQTLATFSGWDPRVLVSSLRAVPTFAESVAEYMRSAAESGVAMPLEARNMFPILSDVHADAGSASGHYFFQDLWVAQQVFAARPASHVDVGSRVDGFIAHLLAFMPVTVVDVRPLTSQVPGLTFVQDNGAELSGYADDSVDSLSSLHAVEHFGLGRYGDPIDAAAHLKAMRTFARVMKPGGTLYFSVPIGRERVEFNAHRIFAPSTVLNVFEKAGLQLIKFAGVGDDGLLNVQSAPSAFNGAEYSCGMFIFQKPNAATGAAPSQ